MTFTPAFPLGTAFLPGDAVVLRVFESRYLDLVNVVMHNDQTFVSSLISARSEVGGGDKRFNAGVYVEIDHVEEAEFGLMLYAHATRPVTISTWNDDYTYPRAECHAQAQASPGASHVAIAALATLANSIDDFFTFLNKMSVPIPAPEGMMSSLVPSMDSNLQPDEQLDLFWSLARLIPSTPLARYELLVDQALTVRIDRAVAEIEHLRDIVAFRYGQ